MTTNILHSWFVYKPRLAALLFVCWMMAGGANAAMAGDVKPLQPIDTSSPRSTLQGFIEFMNDGYEKFYGQVRTYLASSRLYLSPEELAAIPGAIQRVEAVERTIDFSDLPPAMVRESSRRLTLQLKDILDRIDLPPMESVPDAAAMAAAEFKRWTIPGTEIRIARVETGPRAGECLFTAQTANRIPEFYEKVRVLPYQPGASAGLFEFTAYTPAGLALALHRVVPPRWLLALPQWAMATFLDQPVWRWISIFIVLGSSFLAVALCYRLSRGWADPETPSGRWVGLLRPISVVIAAPLTALFLGDVLRVSGIVGKVLTLSLWTVFYFALTWLVWVIGTAVAESVIRVERLRAGSIDSQLIRLMLRLLTIVAAIAILVVGGDRIGLPAYSVVAGLGVGGLAVALAGQQTLANLLGSLIIMLEKPFTLGDTVKVGSTEGVVEEVGFRSTRIRTFYDSLVTIPSSQLVNSTIDNLELRQHREVKTTLNLTYDTAAEQIQRFIEGIRKILESHPGTRKDNIQVAFNDFGPHSLDILLKFFVSAPSRLAELAERQKIFLEILQLAEVLGVKFAFPTETLHIESLPSAALEEMTQSHRTQQPSSFA